MDILRVLRLFVLIALPFAFCSIGSAASLQGKVSEVIDGENFIMVSQTHRLRVSLVATAAPAPSQSYSDVARKHLSDLILNKIVAVRYTGFQDGHLAGQVQCADMDVNAQMIRDGVAWYNSSEGMNLTDVERNIYQASQEAARNEHRGLWQDRAPTSPWEYRKAQAEAAQLKLLPVVPVSAPTPTYRPKANDQGLTNESLISGLVKYSAVAGQPEIKPLSNNPSADRWLKYMPSDRHFSVLFPSVGREMILPVQDLQGNTLAVNYLMAPTETNLFFLFWAKGPNGMTTTESTAKETINAFIDGINASSRHAEGILVEAEAGRNLTLNGYAGREYAVTAGPVSGTVRILSKQIGTDREVFILCVMDKSGTSEDRDNFFNSFKVR
ncbi:MAG TPA: thermonuclease family protein [Pyrinomonadaceae bacterium]|nr:thermonuclease family protein [Pyrinomonadaceae bacterium]